MALWGLPLGTVHHTAPTQRGTGRWEIGGPGGSAHLVHRGLIAEGGRNVVCDSGTDQSHLSIDAGGFAEQLILALRAGIVAQQQGLHGAQGDGLADLLGSLYGTVGGLELLEPSGLLLGAADDELAGQVADCLLYTSDAADE